MIARMQLIQIPTPWGVAPVWDGDLWADDGEPADLDLIDAERLRAHCAPAVTWLASLTEAGCGGALIVLPIDAAEVALN